MDPRRRNRTRKLIHPMLRTPLIACTLLLAATLGSALAERKNVLLIAIDDLRPELGSYGREYAPSPNIDRLAGSGVVFKNHFVQVPTCGASRYALLTGRSPANSKALGNAAFYSGSTALTDKPQPGAQSLPEMFRRNGYHTTLIGKISHTADGKVFKYDGSGDGHPEMPLAWDDFDTPVGQVETRLGNLLRLRKRLPPRRRARPQRPRRIRRRKRYRPTRWPTRRGRHQETQ